MLIVNHAFLAQESLRKQPLLPESPWLIIDEAHHLPDIASRMASERVNSVILKKQVTHFIEKEQLFVALQQIFQQFSEEQRFVKIYQQGLLILWMNGKIFFLNCIVYLVKRRSE